MKLKDKRRVKFVTLTRGNTMVFEDRLAYSFLLASSRGLTVARLSRLSGLDRSQTLPRVVARLTESMLVKREANRHVAIPSEMVSIQADRDGAETWYEKVNYLSLYLPSRACPLTKKQNAVYCLKLAGKDSTSLIAKLLNVSRPTVINAVRNLKEHGLLDALGDPVPLTEEKLAWWEDKVRPRKDADGDLERLSECLGRQIEQFQKSPTEWIALHWWKAEFDKFGKASKDAGYKFRQVMNVLDDVITRLGKDKPIARVFAQLPKLVQKAEETTKANLGRGAFNGSSSFGLFKCKVDDLVKAELKKKNAG